MIDDYVKLCNMTSIDETKNNKRKLIEENLSQLILMETQDLIQTKMKK